MQIRAVLFDLWETLINDNAERSQRRRRWRHASVSAALLKHGYEIDEDTLQGSLDATARDLNDMHDTGRDLDSRGRASRLMEHLASRSGRQVSEAATEDLEAIITSLPLDNAPALAPYAAETIVALKEMGVAAAVVSNTGLTTAPHMRTLLEHHELLRHFEVHVFSDELKVAKPDPLIFEAALMKLGMAASDCAFVGDNPHTDIAGAQAAGLFAIQIGDKVRDGVKPDAQISSLDQLIPTLQVGAQQAAK